MNNMDINRDPQRKKDRRVLAFVEDLLAAYGAVLEEQDNEERRDALGLGKVYRHKDTYYRAEEAGIDGVPVIIVYGINDRKYADLGIDEPLTAFPVEMSEQDIREEIRGLLEEDI